jgi:glutathione S-transferase
MVDAWTEVEAHQYHPAISNIVRQCVIMPLIGGARDQAVVDENVGKLGKVLDVYEARLSSSPYLAGDFFSLADLAHFAFTYFLMAGTEYAPLLEKRASVGAWWGRIMARPAVRKVAALIELGLLKQMPSS